MQAVTLTAVLRVFALFSRGSRYGHLMPGNEDEAAALLDAYLERSDTNARLAQVEG